MTMNMMQAAAVAVAGAILCGNPAITTRRQKSIRRRRAVTNPAP